jgi:hypothetical protein
MPYRSAWSRRPCWPSNADHFVEKAGEGLHQRILCHRNDETVALLAHPIVSPLRDGVAARADRLRFAGDAWLLKCAKRDRSKVDYDMALLVLASGLSADVAITHKEVTERFHRRAHLPIVLVSDLFKIH